MSRGETDFDFILQYYCYTVSEGTRCCLLLHNVRYRGLCGVPVCLSAGRKHELCKTAEAIELVFGMCT